MWHLDPCNLRYSCDSRIRGKISSSGIHDVDVLK